MFEVNDQVLDGWVSELPHKQTLSQTCWTIGVNIRLLEKVDTRCSSREISPILPGKRGRLPYGWRIFGDFCFSYFTVRV